MPNVVFVPSGRRGGVEPGCTVLDAARRLGVDLDSVCGGRGMCGRCEVVPAFGTFPKHGITSAPEHLSGLTRSERDHVAGPNTVPGIRLGCATSIVGDIVIDIPEASQVHRPVVRKSLDLRGLVVDPVVRPFYVEVASAPVGGDRSDLRLVTDALAREWDLTALAITPAALAALQPALARGNGAITVAVHAGRTITGVWPGLVDELLGVAIDVGSTTIAGHLCGLARGEVLATAGQMNPQIRFGEDLMSRVSYVMLHPGGREELTVAVRSALDELIGTLCHAAAAALDRPVGRADISDVVLVANPIMHHLVLGIDPTPLGSAPFALATDLPFDAAAHDAGIACRFATVHALPCIAGHVGADAAAAVLAVGPHRGGDTVLLVDIGTNAELVLGNRDRLFAASSPTGPAFEGAQISAGQRASAGAIERVEIDRDTLEPRIRVIADVEPTGVCGSGLVSAIAALYLAGVVTADGTIDGTFAARTRRVIPDGRAFAYVLHDGPPELRITQNDLRAVQLAKAALAAGARLLLERAGLESGVDAVKLAGAFGNHIDPVDALVLGMIPDCDPDSVAAVGNAAGAGAVRALLSQHDRLEIAGVVRTITKIETAVEPRFQEHFVDALAFPHATDPYPELAARVPLPERRTRTRRRGPGAGRARRTA